ncbi:MAG: hypothetical protein AUF65_02180 [Chloroflexi bacterium 13_1_20CM_50_12]|nr:MAG: hypothetical protein AUF65_02180 [Chloroflexi bacterium 13_1_20CM_50_12]
MFVCPYSRISRGVKQRNDTHKHTNTIAKQEKGRKNYMATTRKSNNKSGIGLNMLIARSHQVATQLVSVQLAVANLLAIAVSAVSIVAGTGTITIERYPENWVLASIAGVIGTGLAILIEGMTLGALIRIRLATQKIRVIDEGIEAERNEMDWSILDKGARKAKEHELRRKRAHATKRLRKMRFWSCPIVLVGSVSSAVAGGLFYHFILAGLGTWESLGVAALFPFIVTCTFISSELFRDIQEEAIKEGYTGGGLADAALREETRRLSFQAVHDGILHHFHDTEIQDELKLGTLAMLKDIIIDLRQTVSGSIAAAKEGTIEAGTALLSGPRNEEETTVSPTQKPDQNASSPSVLTVSQSSDTSFEQEAQNELHNPDQSAISSSRYLDVLTTNTSSDESSETEAQNVASEERKNDPASTSAGEGDTGIIPLNKELLEVVLRYPKVETSWLAKGKKSATIEEIMQVTGQSKRRLNRAPLQRSSRNRELIHIRSVIEWLKTAPLPSQKGQDTSALPAVLSDQRTPTLPEESTRTVSQIPAPEEIPETSRPTRETDTLDLTCQFLREHPEYADSSQEAEQALATHLGLAQPASARFWKIKALEILQAEGAHQDREPVANGHNQQGLEGLQEWVPSQN